MSKPSFCWWCGHPLLGRHVEVRDKLGHEHPVHPKCFPAAYAECKPVTAQPCSDLLGQVFTRKGRQ